MILSREQIDGIAQHHRHDVDLGRWDADELDLIETARAYHDAMDEVERLTLAATHEDVLRLIAERDAARAELSALRDRIAALHAKYDANGDLGQVICECDGFAYPCATVRLLEGDSDGAS